MTTVSGITSGFCPEIDRAFITYINLPDGRTRCFYDPARIVTAAGINNWNNAFRDDPNAERELNEKVYPVMCGRESFNCPNDITGNPVSRCSLLIATDAEGQLCKRWADLNPRLANEPKRKHCLENEEAPECLCINRAADPLFDLLKTGTNPINAKCWWVPCEDPARFLITTDVSDQTCPDVICQQIFTNINNNIDKIDASRLNLLVDCRGTVIEGGVPIWLWIVFAVIGVLILILLLVVIFRPRR